MTKLKYQARLIILKSMKNNNVTDKEIYQPLLNKLTTTFTFKHNDKWIANQFKILYGHGMINARVDYNSKLNRFDIHTRTNHGPLLTLSGEVELNHLLDS